MKSLIRSLLVILGVPKYAIAQIIFKWYMSFMIREIFEKKFKHRNSNLNNSERCLHFKKWVCMDKLICGIWYNIWYCTSYLKCSLQAQYGASLAELLGASCEFIFMISVILLLGAMCHNRIYYKLDCALFEYVLEQEWVFCKLPLVCERKCQDILHATSLYQARPNISMLSCQNSPICHA